MDQIASLEDIDVKGKAVLVRVDINVPMKHGKVSDRTRITRLVPTLELLMERGAKTVLLSHFGRPKGTFNPDMSLAPLADVLSQELGGHEVKFSVDCIGSAARDAVDGLAPGDVLLLENVRFYSGESTNDPEFVASLAELADIYVNDAFSCSHRSHASIVGLANSLPSAAGLLLKNEIDALESVLERPNKPVAALVGGSKVSTKLQLLNVLIQNVDMLVVGGAMANTFLKAQGYAIGRSLHEPDLLDKAKEILAQAEKASCEIILPQDVIAAEKFEEKADCQVCSVDSIPEEAMALDIGPRTVSHIFERLSTAKTILWNGPMGAFEISPFDVGTISVARAISSLTRHEGVRSVAGGGDVVASVAAGGLMDGFTYISTAGGAFLAWLEGDDLPGIAALRQPSPPRRVASTV